MYRITVNELLEIIRSKNWKNHNRNDFICMVSTKPCVNDEMVALIEDINVKDKYLCILPDDFDEVMLDIAFELRNSCNKMDPLNIPFIISSKCVTSGIKMRTFVINSSSVINKIAAFYKK